MTRTQRIYAMADAGLNPIQIARAVECSAKTVGVYLKYRRKIEAGERDGFGPLAGDPDHGGPTPGLMGLAQRVGEPAEEGPVPPRRKRRRSAPILSEARADEAVRMYVDEAMTIMEVATALGATHLSVSSALDARGIRKKSTRSRLSPASLAEMWGMKQAGKSEIEIAQAWNVSATSVHMWLDRYEYEVLRRNAE